MSRGLGWREDLSDSRDRNFTEELMRLGAVAPPSFATLREYVFSILDQSITQSCVAHAIAQAVRITHGRFGVVTPELLSILFLYFAARAVHGDQFIDDGTYIRDAFKSLVKLGYCPAREFPFDPGEVNRPPPWNAYRAAADQRSPTDYYRIATVGEERVNEVKLAIAGGFPVVFGMSVSQAFLDWDGGDAYDPSMEDEILGGHAMCAAEYDEREVRGPNSWSESYGRDGWFAMTWETVVDRWRDIWVVRTAPKFG